MKKIGLLMVTVLMVLSSCIKQIDHDPRCYYRVQNEQITVADTSAVIKCQSWIERDDYPYSSNDYSYSTFVVYGESETDKHDALMEYVGGSSEQHVFRVQINGLKPNTTYNYYYVCRNGFDSIWTETKSFKTEPASTEYTLPTVITHYVDGITANSAIAGGVVIENGGVEVTERGVCWGINENPTIHDNCVVTDLIGDYFVTISGLEPNTTYHVRAYATNSVGTGYGEDKTFTTLSSGGGGDHEYVDLGLPSGTLWATCNVGANSPEEYGDYFAWGETQPKNYYEWNTYQYCNDNYRKLTKYCNDASYGYNGFTDNLTVLQPSDDAATANWGNGWCMPTKDQLEELYNNTTSQWTIQNGVSGRLLTASNGRSLFLPAAGRRRYDELYDTGFCGIYLSSSLYTNVPSRAWSLYLDLDQYYVRDDARQHGLSVRPVRSSN